MAVRRPPLQRQAGDSGQSTKTFFTPPRFNLCKHLLDVGSRAVQGAHLLERVRLISAAPEVLFQHTPHPFTFGRALAPRRPCDAGIQLLRYQHLKPVLHELMLT